MVKQIEDLEKKAADSPTSINTLIGVNRSEIVKSLGVLVGHAVRQPKPLAKNLAKYGKELTQIVQGKSELAPERRDRRFMDPTWQHNKAYKYGLQSWLAMREGFEGWIEDSGISEDDKSRVNFVLNILADSLAPTNTLIGNPAAMKRLFESGGMSVINGMKNAYDDLRNNGGMPSMVDGSQFEVGVNLATSEGSVVYKNEMHELIQYKPTTETVYEVPIVIVPPQINKFYANDLSPEKSVIKYYTSKGYQLYAISWRNPQSQHSHWGLENYVQSLIEATDAVIKITKSQKINMSGACSGGITLASFLNELQARGDDRVNSYTLQVCVLDGDRSDTEMGLFVSDKTIEAARKMSRKKGILEGEQLAKTFAWMRPNDLIWNYVVNNYLLGDQPPAFDILYWNGDTTNLPAQLHSDYLDLALDSRFAKDTSVDFMGHEIDLSKIEIDGFMLAGVTDHITTWKASYRNTHLFGGEIDFVLANAGHIQSLLNPPGNPKAKYFTNKNITDTAEEWLAGAEETAGSWWIHWDKWLSTRSGEQKNSPKKLGVKSYPPTVKAPGEYVFT